MEWAEAFNNVGIAFAAVLALAIYVWAMSR